MAVYLIHFLQPYKHAAHYLGYSPEPQARVNAHLHGKGARLTEVVHDAGIAMIWVRVWEDGDRTLERRLKNRHGSGPLCPICCGEAVQMPLLPFLPAYVPQPELEHVEPEPIDYDAEAYEYEQDQLDREFWAHGC